MKIYQEMFDDICRIYGLESKEAIAFGNLLETRGKKKNRVKKFYFTLMEQSGNKIPKKVLDF